MADMRELEQALANPNVRKMLDLISYTEGTQKHGYHTLVGGSRFGDLSRHPNKVGLRTRDGNSTAAGRYQITGTTWRGLQKEYGFNDFSPQTQDLAAVALLKRRGALNDVLQGDFNRAIGRLGNEWVSLPSSTNRNQGHRSWQDVARFLGGADGSALMAARQSAISSSGSTGATRAQVAMPADGHSPRVAPVVADAANSANGLPEGNAVLPMQTDDALVQTAAHEQAFNQQMDNWRIKPLVFESEPSNPYQQQLAQAFGEYPDMKNQIPNELDMLIQSIYDEA